MVQPESKQFPLHIGSSEDFAAVRDSLRDADLTESTMCRTLNVEQMSDVGGVKFESIDFSKVSTRFRMLFRLFFAQQSVPANEVKEILGASTLDSYTRLGLLRKLGTDRLYGDVLLYPVAGFFMASDRHTSPDGSAFEAPADIVFPAIFGGTLRFLRLLPKTPADASLDLCAGSGIGAFVLSRVSSSAVSSDVTERATHFARFNCELNGLKNVEAVCGDLYGGVAGRTFDRIVAHPPYVPSLDNATIWRDGGVTGELIGRKIIEGLPDYLRPGGIACIVSLGLDTTEGQFEDRIRGWLADNSDEFDLIFAFTNERTPSELLGDMAKRDTELSEQKLNTLSKAFSEAGILRMPHGAIVLKRHSANYTHAAWTMRAKLSELTDGDDFDRIIAFHTKLSDVAYLKGLADTRPVLAERLQVVATHVVHEGSLVPAEFIFETDKPFDSKGKVDGWMVPLFTQFDGQQTLRQIYDRASAAENLPADFKLDDFAGLVARMIERGFFKLP